MQVKSRRVARSATTEVTMIEYKRKGAGFQVYGWAIEGKHVFAAKAVAEFNKLNAKFGCQE